ncbi:MAG: zinc-ribbon domain containing protein [Actinobacteria bacterium]|nr:zinc-ribbon domain containing protein [Actinomycetota bacterium]
MYQDKTLKCKDCGNEFVFTAGEQEFYAEKGFQNEPSRCTDCRSTRRRERNSGGSNFGYGSQREMFQVTCAACGAETEVPFRPTAGRPVYCRDCFQNVKR